MEKSNKLSERSDMADVVQAGVLIRDIVGAGGGTTIGERILLTARKLGWPHTRTRDVWYEQARRIDAREMDQLRAATERRRLEEAGHEYRELRARIARIEAALLSQDAAFHGPTLDALQLATGGPRTLDRSGTRGGSR